MPEIIFSNILRRSMGNIWLKLLEIENIMKTKFKKLDADIAFIKLWKKNNLFHHSLQSMYLYEMTNTS